MYMSIYPTDDSTVIKEIITQAQNLNITNFFTSLHIQESEKMQEFLEILKNLHKKYDFNFFADVSPNTFNIINTKDFNTLKEFGIFGLRIDFGFSTDEIIEFSKTGLQIAVNASTVTKEELVALQGIQIIGWHNFYPRLETGISVDFFKSQNELLKKFNIKIFAFIPGEIHQRIPLYNGLPTLEIQRGKNAFINYLYLKKHYEVDQVIIAEGIVHQENEFLIKTYEEKKVIGIIVEEFQKELFELIKNKVWNIRIEETDFSWRVDNSRFLNTDFINQSENTTRKRGSIHIDNSLYGRYESEIHLIKKDLDLDKRCTYVGHINFEYINILELLNKKPYIIFFKKEDLHEL